MEDLISIIIPVYNCKPYLKECVDSVLNQSYGNIEIILINDGSTDGSEKICDEYANTRDIIHVYHQKNAGVSVARNVGLDKATGTYIFFLDADDVLADNIFEKMINCNPNADLIVGGIAEVNEMGQENGNKVLLPQKVLGQKEMMEALFYEERYGYLGIITPKIYKANIIHNNKIRFDKRIRYNEDRLFITEYVLHCNIIQFTDKYYYYYRQRKESALGQIKYSFNTAVLTELDAFEKIKKLVNPFDKKLYYYVCRLAFEKALYWYGKIPTEYEELRSNTWCLVKKNSKICLSNGESDLIEKIKLVGHCILRR